MDINELESYRLSNAVKFHNELNPRLWVNEKLRPEVREKLLAIADDFREFLGVDNLDIKDITVSGSNAAYTYTPHSDIDLHLVVDLDNVCDNEVYRELFDAKKYQYNNEHNYKIRGYDVELYVQDSKQPHHSAGIYSVVNDDWVKVPGRRQPTIDDISVKAKYVDLGERIEAAIASDDIELIKSLWQKVKTMRQAGLDKTGEFGPENLAFKLLRRAGIIEKLKTAITQAQDHELSLRETRPEKKKIYGYKNYWYPGYDYYANLSTNVDQPGEVDESAQVTVKGKTHPLEKVIEKFVKFCADHLHLKTLPTINLMTDPKFGTDRRTMGHYMDDKRTIEVEITGRHILDIMRTIAHELVHYSQYERGDLPNAAGDTGSPWENEAHATAGVLMRYFDRAHPEFFKAKVIDEGIRDQLAAAAAAACIAGAPGCATTGDAVRGVQAAGTAAQTIKRMGRAGAEEEVMQRLRNELRRRQGQVVPEDVNEALDQPYKILRWEKGDYGDVDAIARLDDNTFLSIMFNKGFSQETKEEAWSVEFYRNNSQEVTGEGDEFRVFATVLNAIQTFISDRVPGAIGKYKPNKVYFSASKQVEPGQKEQSRARLYDSLIQRYARALGFTSSRSDTGNKVMYELNRIKPVAEAQEQCPECGGPMFSELLINEKQDACYYKVKSRYKVWPSAYASGALVQCRKKGAANWGNKS